MKLVPAEWLMAPDANNDGLLKVWSVDGDAEYPLAIETHSVKPEFVVMGAEQEFELIIEGANDMTCHKDAAAYQAAGIGLDVESLIPCGLFPANGDMENFKESGLAIINGVVVATYDDPVDFGFEKGDVIYSIKCLGTEFDAVIPKQVAEHYGIAQVEIGNVISGVYWVQGWPVG